MDEKHTSGPGASHPVKQVEPPLVKVSPENLDRALAILREVLEEAEPR